MFNKFSHDILLNIPNSYTIKFLLKIKSTLICILVCVLFFSSCIDSKKKPVKENEYTIETDHIDSLYSDSKTISDVRELLIKELGEKYNDPVSDPTPLQLRRGKEVYTNYCAPCHGNNGAGNGPAGLQLNPRPSDFTDSIHAHFYSPQGRIHIIKKGISGTSMVGWENTLSNDDILSVYAYIVTLKK